MAGPGQARFYSSTFVQTSLSSGISSGAATWNVGTTTGAPGTPFVVSVDQNTASEELMLVTNVSGLQYTVTRGIGGTSAVAHSNGASVVHVMYAQDLTDASLHIGSYDNVHGLAVGSVVVGENDTQTLTNKTLTSPIINSPTISSPTITGSTTAGAITSSGAVQGTDFVPTGLTGATAASRWVGATTSGMPASGTFNTGDWIVDESGKFYVCTAGGSVGTWVASVNTSAAQTLTNKTLTAPVLSGQMTGSGSINISSFIVANQIAMNGGGGSTQSSEWAGATTSGPPTTTAYSVGNWVIDLTGNIWVCTVAGTPGTWVPVGGSQGVLVAPTTTTSSGTVTVSTTETFDAVLGTYQFTAEAGRRYRVTLEGLVCSASVAADVYNLRIRNSGSASAPTTSSTVNASCTWVCPSAGGSGAETVYVSNNFLAASTGTNTIQFSAQRTSGTGVLTPLAGTGVSRSLYVEDLGNV